MSVLVLGGAGMLGHKLFQGLGAAGHAVSCTVRERADSALARLPLFQEGVHWGIDALDWPSLRTLLTTRRPDVVVNAIGVIKQRVVTSPIPSIQLNSLLPHLVAETIAPWGGRLIHVSSDCVFDGARGHYTEDDRSSADDLYGRSKFLGEVNAAANAVTLRTSIIGRELAHHKSLLDWFLSQDGTTVTGYQRVIYAGTTTNEMVAVIDMVIRKYPALHGLYQVASTPIAKHDLIGLIAKAYGMRVTITPTIEPFSDRSMSGERLRAATGYVSPPWPQLVAALAADPTPYQQWLQILAGK